MMRRLLGVAYALSLGSACDESSMSQSELITMREVGGNDTVLQGPPLVIQGPPLVIQGPPLVIQGPPLVIQGPPLVIQGPAIAVQSIDISAPTVQGQGLTIENMSLNGSSFSGVVKKNGVDYPISGLDFAGAVLNLRITKTTGSQTLAYDFALRFNSIQQSPKYADVYLYDLTYRAKSSDPWASYCGTPGVKAVPMKNYWDLETGDRIDNPKVVTFGCEDAALAKCVLWGYRPWATATKCKKNGKNCQQISLTDHHQACTRMARADYCGTGVPATVAGTLIDIYDNLSPQLQTPYTDWPAEAEWTPDGASCVNYVRHPEFGYPTCFLKNNGKPKKFSHCGDFKYDGALLVSAHSNGVVDDDDDDDDDDQCGD